MLYFSKFLLREVYEFHSLLNGNKEKTLQWMSGVIASKLQSDSFKLPK